GVARERAGFGAGAADLRAEGNAFVGGELRQGRGRYPVVAARTGSEYRGASESGGVASESRDCPAARKLQPGCAGCVLPGQIVVERGAVPKEWRLFSRGNPA